jgi:hypothetical protein
MLDHDGDGVISYQELVAAIQDCWKQGRAVAARNSVEAADALSRVSAALRADKVGGARAG